MHSETHARSIVKSIVWRIVASSLGFAYFYVVTGDVSKTVVAVGITSIVSMIAYYLHERVWNVISWGREDAARQEPAKPQSR